MRTFELAIALILGASIGSFLNVVIHRVPRALSVVRPGSTCPSCETPIRAADNVPIVSYLLLRGRCRSCDAVISARYPMVEAATVILFVASVLRFRSYEEAAFVALVSAVLLALSVTDLEFRRLPNVIVAPFFVVSAIWVLAYGAITGRWDVSVRSFVCAAVSFAVLFLIAITTGGMGFGDVKLAAVTGLFAGRFGWAVGTAGLLGGFFLGGLVSIVLLALGRKGRKDAIPFGPSLAAGALLAVYLGPHVVGSWLGF